MNSAINEIKRELGYITQSLRRLKLIVENECDNFVKSGNRNEAEDFLTYYFANQLLVSAVKAASLYEDFSEEPKNEKSGKAKTYKMDLIYEIVRLVAAEANEHWDEIEKEQKKQ